MRWVVSYAATTIVFLGIDFLWLSFASPNFYRPQLGALLRDNPNLAIAGIFYVFFSAAVVVLAVLPAHNYGNWLVALGLGALLGAAAYGTYDITNLATIRGWSVAVTIVDIIWGALLTGVAATAGYFATRLFGD